jgi:hypothetical protein
MENRRGKGTKVVERDGIGDFPNSNCQYFKVLQEKAGLTGHFRGSRALRESQDFYCLPDNLFTIALI